MHYEIRLLVSSRQASVTAAQTSTRSDPSLAGKQVAYHRFQSALLSGALRPGQFVSQRTLVSMLGPSIGTLRELLPRLEAEGLLMVMPQRGIQITDIDLPMIRDAFQLRMALEREAVLTCVERMTDEDIANQRTQHLDRLQRRQSESSDAFFAECQRIDTAFHQALIDTTGNQLLIQAHAVNAIRIRLIKLERIRLSADNLEAAFRDHLRVLDAIAARDRQGATEAITLHIRNSRHHAMSI